MDAEVIILLSQKKTTNHILHLLLSICTAGVWLIFWFLINTNNSMHNKSIDKKIQRMMRHKNDGLTEIEVHQEIRKEDQYKNKVILVVIAVILFIIFLRR